MRKHQAMAQPKLKGICILILLVLMFGACLKKDYRDLVKIKPAESPKVYPSSKEPSIRVVDIKTRPNVIQRVLINYSTDSKAWGILFAGGDGVLGMDPYGNLDSGNFLIRSRHLFKEQGVAVAIVESPYAAGMDGGFRCGDEHAADIYHVIQYLRSIQNIPVWLIGTSRGTNSAANVASKLEDGADGLILTATLTEMNKRGCNVLELDLSKIKIPTLLVHNKYDDCWATPYSGSKRVYSKLKNVKDKELILFEGGKPGKDCGPFSYHGFYGIEKGVVQTICAWIRAR